MVAHQLPEMIRPGMAVLWDLDGTIVDTTQHHWMAWRAETAQRNINLSWEEFSTTFGQRNDTIIRRWFAQEMDDEQVQSIGESKEVRFREYIREIGLNLLPGVQYWLQRFQQSSLHQALATMTPRANIGTIFAAVQVSNYFQAVVTGDDVIRGKPEPDVFLKAAELLNVKPGQCIVIEDSTAGIQAARRAGMRTIGVNLKQLLDADYYVQSLDQFSPEAFSRLLNSTK